MSESGNFETIVKSLMEGADALLCSKTVVGEPIAAGDTLIIPLSDVTVGCAGGADGRKNSGAGGFHAKMSPCAVLLVKDGSVGLINIKDQNYVNKLIDMAPDLVNRLMSLGKANPVSDEEIVKNAFPEDAGN